VSLPFFSAADVARLSYASAADALEAALLAGFDPEGDLPRTKVATGPGELLVMPSSVPGYAVVKLVSVGGEPRIQGVCVVFDAATLAPIALVDGIALTNLRTAAVSLVAARRLGPPGAQRMLVFGRGPQGRAHADALGLDADFVGRDHGDVTDLVRAADVIVCATTAREPVFDGSLPRDGALVIAVGSHEPGVRETDDALAARAGSIVVESRASARREAGDVLGALESGAIDEASLLTLADLVAGRAAPADPARPRLFKSTGMSWEDGVVASAVVAMMQS
jgi:ornithine cyclodeaminase/alanine dehydrogenase-like protein (mu-crystallin family)